MSDFERVSLGWRSLRGACHHCHRPAAGGAAMCYCGRPTGTTEACAMLKTLSRFFADLDPSQVPEQWREWVDILKRVA